MKSVGKLGRSNGPEASKRLHEDLKRAKHAAMRLYRKYPGVIGVGTGTKYTDGNATDNHAAIQFYVPRKLPHAERGARLPRFVYGRFKSGKINRRVRFLTDVIEVGRVRMACEAGSPISARIGLTRQNGRATFVFKNKASDDRHYYILSCAHVLGDIDAETHIPPIIDSECCPNVEPFATPVFSSSQVDQKVEYDIAIAQVTDTCPDLRDGEIAGTNAHIRSFMESDQIIPPLLVTCVLPLSNARNAVVSSAAGSVTVEYRGGVYEVDNAWLMKAERRVIEGDSGGLVYSGDKGIGVVFASAETDDGWAWFHPLGDAFDFVAQNVKRQLNCFGS